MASFPGVIISYLVLGWLHWNTSIMKEAVFWPYWNRHLLYTNLPSLHAMLQSKLPSMNVQNAYLLSWYSVQHCFGSRNFTAKEVWQWAHARGIHWCYQIPHHPEALGLIERWNGLLKTQLQRQLGDNTLQVLQEAVYALNQCSTYGAIFPKARFMGPGIKGWQWEWHQSLSSLLTH